jgi:sugar lactone lactonase YvrE
MKQTIGVNRILGVSMSALLVLAVAVHAADTRTEITLPGTRVFPESITSTPDGTLIAGSVGHGNVMRIAPGQTTAEEWIKPGTGGLAASVFGVYADEKNKLLWVCSTTLGPGAAPPSVRTFDLKTGAFENVYTLPGTGAFCNDIAVASDGTAYVTDTGQGSVLMWKPGAKSLEIAAKDPLLAGADGLAFGDKTTLYVNSVTAGKLLRLTLGLDGKATQIVDLTLPRKLDRPDGMRAIGKQRLLLAENSGTMSIVTFSGAGLNTVDVKILKDGMASTPGVTATKGMAWVVEGKLNYMQDPALRDKDPGTFKMYAVPLPKP